MGSTKPYLLRAIYEWAEDNGLTPQVLVNANETGVQVPTEHVVDGQIILNISATAVQMHVMDNEFVTFSARFNGIEQNIVLPINAISAIFARENSQGIFFEEMESDDLTPDPDSPPPKKKKASKKPTKPRSIGSKGSTGSKESSKKKANHLKIIK